MTFDYECERCTIIEEHYAPTIERADEEVCPNCGAKMKRLIASQAKIDVWHNTSIPEVDKNIHFRSMKHAKEVMRAKGLSSAMSDKSYERLKVYDLEHQKRREERLERQPVVFDMGRKTRRATG